MNRRQWLKQTGLLAVLGLFASMPYWFSRLLSPGHAALGPRRLPLPGALASYSEFVAACIGCGLCAEVCPPDCIRFYKRSGGSAQLTPYIDPQIKACTLCGKCMKVCPTNALTETAPREINMGKAKILRTACYPWVDRGICGACVSACPLGESAIRYQHGNIYRPVVQDKCVGCGLCVEVCPHPSKPIAVNPTSGRRAA